MTRQENRASSNLRGKRTGGRSLPRALRHDPLTPPCPCGYPLLNSDGLCPRCARKTRWAK